MPSLSSSAPTARPPLPARATPPLPMAAASPSPAPPPPPTDDVDLPRAAVRKIVKARLAQGVPDDGKEPGLSKDAVAALAESAKVFISFITSTANDICRASKRQTLSADDILAALTDAGFDELAAPLRDSLAAAAAERAAAAAATKKRKADAAAAADAPPLAAEVE